MKWQKVYTSTVGILGAAVLLTGCSSGQKPASLGTAGGGTSSGVTGGATGGTSASASASGAGTSPSSGGSTSATGTASSSVPGPSRGGAATTTTPVAGSTGKTPTEPNSVAALAAFNKYTSISQNMLRQANLIQDLDLYADGTAWTLADNAAMQMHQLGSNYTGTEVVVPSVVSLDMNAKPLPITIINACVNDTKFYAVFSYGSKKGQQSSPPISHPFPVTFTLHKSADGHWRVTTVASKGSETC